MEFKNVRDGMHRTVAFYFCSSGNCPPHVLEALFGHANYNLYEVDVFGYSCLEWAYVNKTSGKVSKFVQRSSDKLQLACSEVLYALLSSSDYKANENQSCQCLTKSSSDWYVPSKIVDKDGRHQKKRRLDIEDVIEEIQIYY